MSKGQRFAALFLMLFSMFLLGGISSTKGIILSAVNKDIGLDLSQFGWVVFVFQWGFTVASIITGYWADKKGLKIMTLIGTAIMALGLLGTGLAPTIAVFLGFYMIVGFGLGAMTVASNAVVPAVYPKRQGMMFNIAMGIYGIGMFLMPYIIRGIINSGLSWRYFYIGITAVLILFIFYILSAKVPEGKVEKINVSAFFQMLKKAQFILIMFFLVFYVSAETTFMNFFPKYVETLNLSGMTVSEKADLAAEIISIFSILFTIGRLLGGYINKWLGEKKTLMLFSILATLFVLFGKLFANQFVMLFAGAGLFFSVLFPTATGLGTKMSKNGGSALGLVYVAAGLGGAFAGLVEGYVSQAFGSAIGFYLPVVFLFILFLISLGLKDRSDDETAEDEIENTEAHHHHA